MESRKMFARLYGITDKKGNQKEMLFFDDIKKVLVGKIWTDKFEKGSEVYELLLALPNTVEDPSDREQHKIFK